MKNNTLIPIALAAAFFNIIPLLLVVPSGDIIMNYAQVECYSKQLWSGILYPRWCMDANGGMGSAVPIFYFPLPYYITAIFAPLKYFGLTTSVQYLLGVYTANFTAFLCGFAWFSRIVSRRTACFCAFIFLFGFYRAEMITRASYGEYWCVAFMPLLFMYAREACHARFKHWPKLALVTAICMFCHTPATLIGLIGAGLYIVLNGRAQWRALIELVIAGALATLITLFHYLPTKLLVHTLNDELGGINHWRRSWINSFVNTPQVYHDNLWMLLSSCIGLMATFCVTFAFYRHRNQLPEDKRRECFIWIAIGAFALFMMFSVSAPLWNIVQIISGVATPWRIQALVMFALLIIFSIMSEYVWFKNARTKTGDKALCSLFFIFLFLLYNGGVYENSVDVQKRIIASQFIIMHVSTHDIDTRYKKIDLFFDDFIDRPNRRQVEWVQGSGALAVEGWDAKAITVRGHADMAGTLRLEHFQYPIWQAELNGKMLPISAEPITGRMLLAITEGDFTLRITQHYWDMMPKYFWLTKLSALTSLLIIGFGFWRLRCGYRLRA